MAGAITSGGGLGQSKGDAFLQLTGAFGAIAGGLAIMGGAKLYELKEGNTKDTESELFSKENNAKEDNRSSKNDKEKEIMAKANRNVENEANGRYSGNSGGNSNNTSDNGLGVRYNKGRGVPKNFKKAEDSFRDYKEMKKKSGLGAGSMLGLGAAMFFQAGTMDLSNWNTFMQLGKQIKDATGSNNQGNYPYNVMSRTEQLKMAGYELFKDGLKDLENKLKAAPVLVPEMGSMNEATKGNAYYGDGSGNNKNRNDYYERRNPGQVTGEGNNYISNTVNTPLLGANNTMETYINNLETMNRNNPNRIISQPYNRPEDIANVIKNFHKKTQ